MAVACLCRPVTKILERCQKWNGVPILSCKIWHGQENNGMADSVSGIAIPAIKGLCGTKKLFMLDRQGVIQIDKKMEEL